MSGGGRFLLTAWKTCQRGGKGRKRCQEELFDTGSGVAQLPGNPINLPDTFSSLLSPFLCPFLCPHSRNRSCGLGLHALGSIYRRFDNAARWQHRLTTRCALATSIRLRPAADDDWRLADPVGSHYSPASVHEISSTRGRAQQRRTKIRCHPLASVLSNDRAFTSAVTASSPCRRFAPAGRRGGSRPL